MSNHKSKKSKELKKDYESIKPILRKCRDELKRIITTQLKKAHNPELVRVRLTEARVKSLPSLWRKAKIKKWKNNEILEKANDLVGFRIVCANLEDIQKVKELLINNTRINEIVGSEEDHTQQPTPTGYRDYKFNIQYETGISKYENITCEIQIRTMIQDSWAVLSHKDIYKNELDLPETLKKLSIRLSDLMNVADKIAQDIREQVSQKREPQKSRGRLLNNDTLRRTYKKVFNDLPPDYLVLYVKNKCENLGITNIKPLETALLSERNRKRLQKAYRDTSGWEISNELLFEMAPLITVYGINIAVDAVKKRAKIEWEDVERVYRSEIESERPETYEEFLEYMEPHDKDDFEDFPDRVYRIAEIFKVLDSCSICSAPIVDPVALQEGVEEFYEIEDTDGKIQTAIIKAGADPGENGLCSYHNYVVSKED